MNPSVTLYIIFTCLMMMMMIIIILIIILFIIQNSQRFNWFSILRVTDHVSRGISYVKYENGRLTGLVTSYVQNCLLKQVIEGKIKGEMEVTRRRGRRR